MSNVSASEIDPAKKSEPEVDEKRLKINRVEIDGELIEFRGQNRQDQFIYETFFKGKRNGTFFECGALDGKYLSNTYAFEAHFGWRGVMVEPLTAQYEMLVTNRPNSKCYHACVGSKEESVLFFNHKGGGLSGIVKEVGRRHIERLEYSYSVHPLAYQRNPDLLKLEWKEVKNTTKVITEAGITHVDFFSLDVEGGEDAVLAGLDLDQVTVDLFCVEMNPQSNDEVSAFFNKHDYVRIASVGQDLIYLRREFYESFVNVGVDLRERMKAVDIPYKLRME